MFVISFSDSEKEDIEEYGKEFFDMIDNNTLPLLSLGFCADHNYNFNLEKCYYKGYYLLDWAILNDKMDSVNWILQHSLKKVGNPFHIAVLKNNLDIIDLLAEWGYNPNRKDINGNTPLHLAVKYNKRDLVKYLLRYNKKISINKVNKNLESPLKIALDNYYFDIAKALILRGAIFKNDMSINYDDPKIRIFLERENTFITNKLKNKMKRLDHLNLIRLYDSFISSGSLDRKLQSQLFTTLNLQIDTEYSYLDIEYLLLKKILFYKIYNR